MTEMQTSQQNKRSKRIGYIQFGVVIAFIISSFVISGLLNASKKPVTKRDAPDRTLFAQTELINPAPYRISFDTTGVVKSRADVAIVSQVSGRIISINENFFTGGTFKANETLFEIDPLDFKLEVQRLEAQVAQARTALDLERAESQAAMAEWQQINGDRAVPDLVARKPQQQEAKANLDAAIAQLDNAKLDLKRSKFSLPFSGRVISSELERGQYISAGQNYGNVYDISRLEVQSSLEDRQLHWLLSAQKADITINSNYLGKNTTYTGVLRRGVSSLNEQTRFASISFGFANSPMDIIPGVFVKVNVQGPELDNVTLIPSSAMQKGEKIWSVDENNMLRELKGTIVFSDEDHIVLSGINQPAQVVTSRMPGAIEGMKVNLTDSNDTTSAPEPAHE